MEHRKEKKPRIPCDRCPLHPTVRFKGRGGFSVANLGGNMGNMVGRKNIYTCEWCQRNVVTVDRDDGVTPFLIDCLFGCRAVMKSSFYRVPQGLTAEYEWYKPDAEEIDKMTPAMRQHVEQGGLDLRKIDRGTVDTGIARQEVREVRKNQAEPVIVPATLREKLREWTDWDGTAFTLAVVLGIMEDGQESWLKNKGVFWSANPLGDALVKVLNELVGAGLLEHRSEPDSQYRWKPRGGA